MIELADDIRAYIDGAQPITLKELDTLRRTRLTSTRPQRTRRARQSARRLAGVAAVAVAAVAALALIVSLPARTTQRSHPRPLALSAPAVILRHLEEVAYRQQVIAPGPGQFVFQQTELATWFPGDDQPWDATFWVTHHYTQDTWQPATGWGRATVTPAPTTLARPSDEAAWRAAGSPPLLTQSSIVARDVGVEIPGFDPTALSSDPSTLLAQLQAIANKVNQSQPVSTTTPEPPAASAELSPYGLGVLALEMWQTPPDVRSAVFQLLQDAPGITVQQGAKDHSGRSGVGVTFTSEGITQQLIIDPSDSLLLGSNMLVTIPADQWLAPTAAGLTSWTVFGPFSVVNSGTAGPS